MSYAHSDKTLCKALEKQLAPYEDSGLFDIWSDRDITAGAEWEPEIRKALAAAHIVLLLVSPDFLTSAFCKSVELRSALDKHERGETLVIPVILRPCEWQFSLGKLQALPEGAKPVLRTSKTSTETALHNVAQGIAAAAQKLESAPPVVGPGKTAVIAASPTAAPARRPLKLLHVDREQEMAIFRGMLRDEGSVHVLLIQAEGGMGKTSLLLRFWEQSDGLKRIRLNLKQMSYTVGEVLGELSTQFDAAAFRRFSKQRDVLSKAAPDHYRQQITDAFVADLLAANPDHRPVVLLFDTFEAASDEIKEWLTGLFLRRVVSHRWLVVVVAGRTIPNVDIDWEDWCQQKTLSPLSRDHVREYLEHIIQSPSEREIALMHTASEGRPLLLATLSTKLLAEPGATSD